MFRVLCTSDMGRTKTIGTVSTALLIVATICGVMHIRANGDDFATQRQRMVQRQIAGRDVVNPAVLRAMTKVPRHLFVPEAARALAYRDSPLRIGQGQTISQPYIVAKMTELAALKAGCKVLEIGTGSGYQAAVLAEMGCTVYTIEIIESLSKQATEVLKALGYKKAVHTKVGDGYAGWKAHAPFDAVIVTAAPPHIPRPLKEQLKVGGRLVIPVGNFAQQLLVITRTATGYRSEVIFDVVFVPMTGKAQQSME